MKPSTTLAPLFDKTPLALERLRLVWRDLSVLDRADVISTLLGDIKNEPRALRWRHHRAQVADIGLADPSAYIRYLAAKDVSEPHERTRGRPGYAEERERYSKVVADPFSLVRLASEESDWKFLSHELKNPAVFWALPQTERLVSIAGVKESGEEIAELLRFASKNLLPTASVTIDEVLDVLLQYLGGKSIAERVADSEDYARRFVDGYAEYSAGQSVKALWQVIPDVPKELAYVLLECLPVDAGFESDLAASVIGALDEHQLSLLLYRDDVPLKQLRRDLFEHSPNEHLRDAAVSSFQFDLLDSDITPLVYRLNDAETSGKEKVNALAKLAESCRGATLAQMRALCYLIRRAPTDFHTGFGKWDAAAFGAMLETQRAKKLSRTALAQEIRQLRLFELATSLTPIQEGDPVFRTLPPPLRDRNHLLLAGNPWQTYLNLKSAVRDLSQLESYLPTAYIEAFDIPKDIQPDTPEEQPDESDSRQVFDLLSDVQERVRDISDQDRAELSALGKALSQISEQSERLETALSARVAAIEARLAAGNGRLTLLLWITLAILLILLFKGNH